MGCIDLLLSVWDLLKGLICPYIAEDRSEDLNLFPDGRTSPSSHELSYRLKHSGRDPRGPKINSLVPTCLVPGSAL